MNCQTHVNPAAQLHGDCPLSGPAGVPSLRWGTSWHTRSMPRVQQPLFPGHPGYPWIILRHTATHCNIQIIHLPFRWRRYVHPVWRSIHDCCSGNMADFIARNQPVHCLWTCFFPVLDDFGRCLPGDLRSFGIAFTSFLGAPMSCFFPGPSDPQRCSKMPAEWCDSDEKWIKLCFS